MSVASWCCKNFCAVPCVSFCTGHFVMVHGGILYFNLTILRGLCDVKDVKQKLKIMFFCDSVVHRGPFWRVSVMTSRWFKTKCRAVNGNLDACWYAVHIIMPKMFLLHAAIFNCLSNFKSKATTVVIFSTF